MGSSLGDAKIMKTRYAVVSSYPLVRSPGMLQARLTCGHDQLVYRFKGKPPKTATCYHCKKLKEAFR